MTNIDPGKELRGISLKERLLIRDFVDEEVARQSATGLPVKTLPTPFDAEARLQVFHKTLERLEKDERAFVLDWSTAIAERLSRYPQARRADEERPVASAEPR